MPFNTIPAVLLFDNMLFHGKRKFIIRRKRLDYRLLMTVAIISDIHANIEALEAVLAEIEQQKPGKIICLGDLVGYGPSPNECIELIREKNISTVLGNHDAAITGSQDMKLFREPNHSLLTWTEKQLTTENLEFLNELPLTLENENWMAAHASPYEPKKWVYLNSAILCRKMFSEFSQDFCFVGHTHIPAVVPEQPGIFTVKPGFRYIINPGSVAQSRDDDKRASYGILDLENASYFRYRVSYSNEKNRERLGKLGYSDSEIKKLLRG